MHEHQTQSFEELVPLILPLLKSFRRLGHAGIVGPSVWFINTRERICELVNWILTSSQLHRIIAGRWSTVIEQYILKLAPRRGGGG